MLLSWAIVEENDPAHATQKQIGSDSVVFPLARASSECKELEQAVV